MTGRAGVGAVLGLWVGIGVVFVVVLVPRIADGDFYEVGDPLVHLGLPVLAATSVVGALGGAGIGLLRRAPLRLRARRRTQVAGVAGIVCLAALYGWGVG